MFVKIKYQKIIIPAKGLPEMKVGIRSIKIARRFIDKQEWAAIRDLQHIPASPERRGEMFSVYGKTLRVMYKALPEDIEPSWLEYEE